MLLVYWMGGLSMVMRLWVGRFLLVSRLMRCGSGRLSILVVRWLFGWWSLMSGLVCFGGVYVLL